MKKYTFFVRYTVGIICFTLKHKDENENFRRVFHWHIKSVKHYEAFRILIKNENSIHRKIRIDCLTCHS